MPQQIVVTVLGDDRPGLIEELSGKITQGGGNWVESRMAELGGAFAGVLRIEIEQPAVASLEASLNDIEGLDVTLRSGDATPDAPGVRKATFTVMGHDRPGIVHEITTQLASLSVNVEELVTGTESAAMSGEEHFRAHLEVGLPDGLEEEALRSALESLASDLMVDFEPA